MEKLIEQVKNLANKELEESKVNFEKQFNSRHEGYGYMKEEVEEASDEMVTTSAALRLLWRYIKQNESSERVKLSAGKIEKYAILTACECIQVAAMAEKCIERENDKEVKEFKTV